MRCEDLIDTKDKIKLTDNYYLGSDGKMNFMLMEVYEKREGKGRHAKMSGEYGLQTVGYYGSLNNVVKGLLRNVTLKHKGEEFSEYVDIVKDVEYQITKNMKEFLPNKPKDWK